VATIESDMSQHEAANQVHDRLQTPPFDGQIVLETPSDPDSAKLLKDEHS